MILKLVDMVNSRRRTSHLNWHSLVPQWCGNPLKRLPRAEHQCHSERRHQIQER